MTKLDAAIPTSPLVDDAGYVRPEWRVFLTRLWLRTGGSTGQSTDTSALEAQLAAETAARQQGDIALGGAVQNEAALRIGADNTEAQVRAAQDTLLVPKTNLGRLWSLCDLSFLPKADPGHGQPWLDSVYMSVGTVAPAALALEDGTGAWSLEDGSGHWLWADSLSYGKRLDALESQTQQLAARYVPSGRVVVGGAQPGVTSAAHVLCGLGATIPQPYSTRLALVVDGQVTNSATNGQSYVQLVIGTGTPPAAGTSLAASGGTALGLELSVITKTGGDLLPFARSEIVSGLVLGTTYWFDVARRTGGTGTTTLSDLTLLGASVLDPYTFV